MRLATRPPVLVSLLALACLCAGVSASPFRLPALTPLLLLTPPADLLAIAVIALTISVDVVAIGYIIGKVIPSSGVLTWLGNEYWEIAKSAILIVSIFAILTFLGNVAVAIGGPSISGIATKGSVLTIIGVLPTCPGSEPFATLSNCASVYLNNIQNDLVNEESDIFNLAATTGALRNLDIGYSINIPPIPLPEPPYPIPITFTFGFQLNFYRNFMLYSDLAGVSTYESIVNDLITILLLPISIVNLLQYALLIPLAKLGLGVLIPIGIIMRAFPFIRGVGGTLIALGIGIALVYPAALVIVNQSLWNAMTGASYLPATPFVGAGCNLGLLCVVIDGIANFGINLGAVFWVGFGSTASLYPALNYLNWTNFELMVYLVLFILDVLIVYPIMDSLAKLLGNPAGIKLQIGGKLKL